MVMKKLRKFVRNIQGLNWGEGVEATKTGAEAAKAVFDLAKAVKENQPNLQNLKPYVEQFSSLFDVFNTPLGQVTKEVIPFAPLAITILQVICDATKQEPSLADCVFLVSQAAYIDSFQEIRQQKPDLFQQINLDSKASDALARQIQKLGEQDFDERETKKAIVYFHASKLAEAFNQILQQRLEEAGLKTEAAADFTQQVARKTDDYMLSALVKVGDKVKQLVDWYSAGGKEKLEKNLSIEDYLETVIAPKPQEYIFDETQITFEDLYVPLQVKEVDDKSNQNLDSEEWIKAILREQDPKKPKQVLFIQGEAGRGKSVFCRMFADWVRRELHPSFTPILIRLRDLRALKDNLTDTLENYLENLDFVQSDSGWLTDKNTRFLFLLDGFDELLLEGRASGGLKEFLEQVERFQKDSLCHHQFLVTGRPLALQGIDRLLSQTKSLKRVELQPMDDVIREDWLKKWAAKVGEQEAKDFEQFLLACPDEIKNKLAREPLLLYLLGRMHREKHFNVQMFAGAEGIQAKIRIYDESVRWVLEKQRGDDNDRLTNLESEDLRQFMTEAALCVVQSGNESARLAILEARLNDKDSNSQAAKLIQQARQESYSEKNQQQKLLNNLLTAFYIKPASGDKGGAVEFVHKSFSEFLFAERLIESFVDWTTKVKKRQREEDFVPTDAMNKQIYDLLGYGNLTREIVDYLMGLLATSPDFKDPEHLLNLFQRLEEFYFRWCDGEFIDAEDANLPLIKKKQLREQLPERENHLGLRQVDIYTGLNVMIVLLELHRYGQSKDDLKDQINFHPCGKPNTVQFDSQRLRQIISSSHSLGVSAFIFIVGLFLRGANLSHARLSNANLSNANLNNADLSDAILMDAVLIGVKLIDGNLSNSGLRRANLIGAILTNSNLSNASLREANLSGANLSGANLSGANLSGANLSGANLSYANIGKVIWDSETKWLNTRGLHKCVGVSLELEQNTTFASAFSLSQGISWLREGKIEEAKKAFEQALNFNPTLNNSAESWNSIGWLGTINGDAEYFLHYCEQAVILSPHSGHYQYNRGLARLLTGDMVGALADIEAAVDSGVFNYYPSSLKEQRLRWLEALKLGNNPLTPEELEELRQKELYINS
ncbi:pentapeptide repeat-containing protein [Anabaena minutissima FACHB-250]|nr:pentapeptide repeat-containing protein [Anabaena minutissima FACHB-250]